MIVIEKIYKKNWLKLWELTFHFMKNILSKENGFQQKRTEHKK